MYFNSSIVLPNSKSSKYASFYITAGGEGKSRTNEVLQQIMKIYPTLQTTFTQIQGIYAGSLLKLPIRWSPMNVPYLSSINGASITFDGFAANMDCTMYWIAMPVERPAYDAKTTVDSTHIRYLVSYRLFRRPSSQAARNYH